MSQHCNAETHLPECVIEYIEELVRALDLDQEMCVEVRKEIENHFEDALRGVEGEPDRTRIAEKLVAEFGDEAVLAALIRRGKKRCRKESMMNKSGIAGLVLFVFVIVPAISMLTPVSTFVNLPSFICCAGLTTALGMMSFGLQDLIRGVWALRALLVRIPPEAVSSRETSVLRGLIGPVYASGLIGAVIGVISMLAALDDPRMLGSALAVSLLCPFYAVLVAEGVFRPAVRLIEHGEIVGTDASHPSPEREAETETELA